ncbi:MAG: hypothetical protein ACLFV0_00540 [Nitriliruptoraceae bacterium]
MSRRSIRSRLRPVGVSIALVALTAAAALPAAAVEEGPLLDLSPEVVPEPPDATIVFQSIECEAFEDVLYNPAGGDDDTFGNRPDAATTTTSTDAIDNLDIGDCVRSAGASFTVGYGARTRTVEGDVATYTIDGSVPAGPTQADGTFSTPLSVLLGSEEAARVIDDGDGPSDQLWVTLDPRPGSAFGALQCTGDVRNDDNLEFLQDVPGTGTVYCTAWTVRPPAPVVPTPAPTAPPVVEVLSEQVIQRDQQTVTASGPEGSSGSIELDFGDEVDADVGASLSLACEALASEADPAVRLTPELFVVVPSSFDAGDEVIVTTSIDAEDVQQEAPTYAGLPTGDLQIGAAPRDPSFDTPQLQAERLAAIRTNRGLPLDPDSDLIWLARFEAGTHTLGDARTALSAKAFHWSAAAYGVCFAGEKADPGDLTGLAPFGDTGLFGPVLLPTCSDDVGAPCVSERTLTEDGAVELVSRIPAEDPWMR